MSEFRCGQDLLTGSVREPGVGTLTVNPDAGPLAGTWFLSLLPGRASPAATSPRVLRFVSVGAGILGTKSDADWVTPALDAWLRRALLAGATKRDAPTGRRGQSLPQRV